MYIRKPTASRVREARCSVVIVLFVEGVSFSRNVTNIVAIADCQMSAGEEEDCPPGKGAIFVS